MATPRGFHAARRIFARSSTQFPRPIQRFSSLTVRQTIPPPKQLRSVRQFSAATVVHRDAPASEDRGPLSSDIPPPTQYAYEDISVLTKHPDPKRIIIDVREPHELLDTGRIPTAKSVPISSGPDAFFMPAEDFDSKFGFPRPGQDQEVIFYCKSGVRSRQAALLAGQARPSFGGRIGNYGGSWLDWQKNGGKVEKEGEQGK